MRLFDSHAHIGSPDLEPQSDTLLERAREEGVVGVIAVGAGYGVGPNGVAVSLAERHPDVWASVGVHPHDASEWNELSREAIDGWLLHSRVQAVGECGLDYHYDRSPREQQQECLRDQIALARTHAKPLVIHVRAAQGSRDAYDDLLRIFDDAGADQCGGVIHCFTGDRRLADDCMARGFDLSFSGILTFKNAEELRSVARALPLERLMVETDSPLLAPVPYRGRRNEPAYVTHVVACLAELLGVSAEVVAGHTTERACRRFGIRLAGSQA
jgi:TatD DNase family protein